MGTSPDRASSRSRAGLAALAALLLGVAVALAGPASAHTRDVGQHVGQNVGQHATKHHHRHHHKKHHHHAHSLTWAPAGTAAIHPGTMMYTDGAQCTANFVYSDRAGHVYVGYAAHCAGTGGSTDTNGCSTGSVPLGTRVDFTNDGTPVDEGTIVGHGTLVYSSWITEHQLGTTDADTCAYNDLALVEVDAADVGKVNPSVPFWGGPTGIDTDGTAAGDQVFTFGNSSLRGGVSVLSPHTGISLGDDPADGGWSHPLYTLLPGIPGDSGSGFMTAGGKAVGVLSTLGLAPLPLSNNIGDLAKELAFAQQYSGLAGLGLVDGTVPFNPVL